MCFGPNRSLGRAARLGTGERRDRRQRKLFQCGCGQRDGAGSGLARDGDQRTGGVESGQHAYENQPELGFGGGGAVYQQRHWLSGALFD